MPFLRSTLFLSIACLTFSCSSEGDEEMPSGSGSGFEDGTGGLISEDCVASNGIMVILGEEDLTDVIQERLVSTISLTDGLTAQNLTLEIWSFKNGEPDDLVWTYTQSEDVTTFNASLSDGDYIGGLDALESFQDHGIRAGYKTDGCQLPDWTEWQTFTTESGASYFFESTTIPTLDFHIPAESFGSIDTEARPPDCVPYERLSLIHI